MCDLYAYCAVCEQDPRDLPGQEREKESEKPDKCQQRYGHDLGNFILVIMDMNTTVNFAAHLGNTLSKTVYSTC